MKMGHFIYPLVSCSPLTNEGFDKNWKEEGSRPLGISELNLRDLVHIFYLYYIENSLIHLVYLL